MRRIDRSTGITSGYIRPPNCMDNGVEISDGTGINFEPLIAM